jgi:serpin B
MTHAGARGETAQQIAAVLHLPDRPELVYATFADLHRQLNADAAAKNYQLLSANGLWAPKGFPFLPDYLRVLQELYGASVREADFAGDADGVRRAINAWVAEQTRQKIPQFLPEGGLADAAPPVWVNAVYFKSAWAGPFRKERTKPGPFFVRRDQSTPVPFMQQVGGFRHADAGPCEILELPYKGQELRMLVLLPKDRDGLPELEKQLTAANLGAWLGRLKRQSVEVLLPRFQLTGEAELSGLLKALGMGAAFGQEADFSGVHGGKGSFQLGEVLHKAVVEVNEEGTEAAAATGVKVPRSVSLTEPRPFKADHPFCFLIQDTRSGCILFLGRLVAP